LKIIAPEKKFQAITQAVKIGGLTKRTCAKVYALKAGTFYIELTCTAIGHSPSWQNGSTYHEPTYFKVSTLLNTAFLYNILFKLAPNGLLPNLKLLEALKIVSSTGATPSLLQRYVCQHLHTFLKMFAKLIRFANILKQTPKLCCYRFDRIQLIA